MHRYMATSDLLNELKKDGFRADADLERKLSNVILNQLEDASGDISNLAVSWWVPGGFCNPAWLLVCLNLDLGHHSARFSGSHSHISDS